MTALATPKLATHENVLATSTTTPHQTQAASGRLFAFEVTTMSSPKLLIAALLGLLAIPAAAQSVIVTGKTIQRNPGQDSPLEVDANGKLIVTCSTCGGGGQLPAVLGSQADALSLAVTQSTEDKAALATLTAKFPSALTGGGALKVAPVDAAGNELNYAEPANSTPSSVNDAATSTTCLASNANRQGARFYNDSTVTAYLLEDEGTASTTNFTVKLIPDAFYSLPMNASGVYTDNVKCIWASDASGAMRVTEIIP